MTEIPEHLRKRAEEARKKAEAEAGGGDDAGSSADSSDEQTPEQAAGQAVRQTVIVRQGIDKELAKKLTKHLKQSKLKVQAAIQGDEVRVSGKKRDDLQAAMALLRKTDADLPLQFENLRD